MHIDDNTLYRLLLATSTANAVVAAILFVAVLIR